jgi:hypothetical protein
VIALAVAAAAVSPPVQACPSITVYAAGSGTYTYPVRIQGGGATCTLARDTLRRFIAAKTAPPGWTCARSHGQNPVAATCARGSTTVEALAPTLERDRWKIAAARLDMPVLAPSTVPAGLTLRYVKPEKLKSCGDTKEQVTGVYRGGGKEVYVIEGKPRVCGDIGEAKQVGKPRIHGRQGAIFDFGGGSYLLIWSERGIQVGVQTKGYSKAQLVAIGQSFEVVAE